MDLPADLNDPVPESIWGTYKIPILLGGVSLFLIVLSIVLLLKSTQTTTPIQFSRDVDGAGGNPDVIGVSTLSGKSANLGTISVDIEGAVARPGIISLPAGSRVEDAIQAAGGLQKTADAIYISQNINRAMKLTDGMKIYIPEAGEDMTSHTVGTSKSIMETSHNFSTLLQRPEGQSQNGVFVSVNMASKSQLESLSGVGPATAQKIIDNRPYTRLEDLVEKKAIGPSLFEKLKSQLSL